MPGANLTDSDIDQLYKKEVADVIRPAVFCGMQQLHAVASILGTRINSLYDEVCQIPRESATGDALYNLVKTMAKIVKGTFIVNHEDDKATEIDKFVVVLELNHASVFGDATYQINLSRQTKLRQPQNLPVDEDVAKVREYTVRTIESLTSSHDELSCDNFILLRDLAVCRLNLFNFRRGGEPVRLRIADWVDAQNDVRLDNTRIKKMHPVEEELFSLQGTCLLIS